MKLVISFLYQLKFFLLSFAKRTKGVIKPTAYIVNFVVAIIFIIGCYYPITNFVFLLCFYKSIYQSWKAYERFIIV